MLTRIRRQDCYNKYPGFPQSDYLNEVYTYPKVFKSYVLTVDSKSAKGHIKILAAEIIKLLIGSEIHSLIFLGDANTPWLKQENEYKPVKEATNYLLDHKINRRFNGAIRVETSGLPEFLKHLFWLTRCNAALPVFYFMDEGQNFVGNICKYGNLHL